MRTRYQSKKKTNSASYWKDESSNHKVLKTCALEKYMGGTSLTKHPSPRGGGGDF